MNNYYSIVAFVSLVGDSEVVIFPFQGKKSGDVDPVIFPSKKKVVIFPFQAKRIRRCWSGDLSFQEKGGDLPVPSKKNQEMLVR
jgi:hypothetical protein